MSQRRKTLPSLSSATSQCSICEVTFRRPEHLKRHLRSHTKEKPFQCIQCDRCFSRSDTLYRHDQSHHAPGIEGSDRIHRITVKTFRACSQCASARVRCSGDEPCHRCQSRTISCQYPTERRSKHKSTTDPGQRSTGGPGKASSRRKESTGKQVTGDMSKPHVSTSHQSSPAQSIDQRIQFRFINYNSAAQSDTAEHESSAEREGLSVIRHQTPNEQATDNSQVRYPSDIPQTYSPNSAAPFPLDVAGTILTQEECMNHLQASENAMSLDIPQPSVLDLPISPELFQSVEDLNLNWLPIDISRDVGSLLPMDTNMPYGAVSDWWPESLNAKNDWLQPAAGVNQVPLFTVSEQASSLPFAAIQSPQSLRSLSQDGSPTSMSNDEAISCGDYYVDGEGSRLTKQKRRRKSSWNTSHDTLSSMKPRTLSQRSRLAFPPLHEKLTQDLNRNISVRKGIPPDTYEKLLDMFDKTCRTEVLFSTYEPTSFPTADLLAFFLYQYLEDFQPVYPIIHKPTFEIDRIHWILVLAMSAIGSCLINSPEAAPYAYPLQEFARRAILIEKEKYPPGSVPIWLIQAMLLNCIGLHFGGDDQPKGFGFSSMSDLVRFTHQEGLLANVSDLDDGRSWKEWVIAEMRRRTGYFIWLLDSTLAYTTTNFRPLFTLRNAQAPLPSHESLWDAKSEEEWQNLYHGDNVSLHSATEILFIEKRLVPDICEFGQTLLTHALYQRLWEVSDYFQSPLACWNPNAERQRREAAIPSNAVWLPGVPMYSKWRNSACDCLDTLHWFANETIAKAAGMEHPTVLHLHAARVVLLVPFREIRSLATLLANATTPWDSRLEQSSDWQHAWRWVRHDQYKARLAMIHAGSVLWYVRRYSVNAFHEPGAVFLATLALWAYGLCMYNPCSRLSQISPQSTTSGQTPGLSAQQQQQSDMCESDSNPTFIHLDRPCDDEIVQLFVRDGQAMRGNVTGVGNICGPQGPSKVLKEGIRILSTLVSTWGITQEYIDILSRLRDRTSSPMVDVTLIQGPVPG